MIRDDVIFWVSAALLVFFAFVVMPANEYFKDAQGREVDVDPNAPPKPEWLKPISERTGKKEGFWGSFTSFFSPTRERMTGGAAPTFADWGNQGEILMERFFSNEQYPRIKSLLGEMLSDLRQLKITSPTAMATQTLPPPLLEAYSSLVENGWKLNTIEGLLGITDLSGFTTKSSLKTAMDSHLNEWVKHNPATGIDPGTVISFVETDRLQQNSSGLPPGVPGPPLSGVTAQQSSTLPQFNTDSTLGSTTGTTGMERTLTRGDLMETQVRFIQTLIGNEPDQATKRALSEGLATLQQLVRGSPPSVSNVPIGSTDKAVLAGLTNVPSSYTYRQFAYAYQSAGGVNSSPENIVNMVQSIPSGFNAATAPRPTISTISQMSQMEALAPPDLYGPGPNVLRSALQGCSCGGSQTSSCPIHA